MQVKVLVLLVLALLGGFLLGSISLSSKSQGMVFTNITEPAFACPEVQVEVPIQEQFEYIDDEDVVAVEEHEETHVRQDPFRELGREDQFLIDYVVGKNSAAMHVFIEFGTGDGVGTVALSRHANAKTKIFTFDVTDGRHGFVKEQWPGMAARKAVSFHLLDASGDLEEQVHSVLKRSGAYAATPSVVIFNPRWEHSVASAVLELGGSFSMSNFLRYELSHLAHDSVLLIDPMQYIRLLEELEAIVATDENEDEDSAPSAAEVIPFHYDTELAEIRDQLDATLTAVRLNHPGASPPFDEALLPPGATLQQADLQPSRRLEPNDWLIFMRIPKCGTKSMVELLKPKTHSQRGCSGDFLTSPHMKESCHIVTLCSEGAPKMYDIQQGKCQLIQSHHCDWNDVVPPGIAKAERNDVDVRLVTVIRDPVHRVVSEYKHTYGKPKAWDYCPSRHSEHPQFTKEHFIDHLLDEQNGWGMRNRQTRMLAGCGTIDECNDSDEELLARAKEHVLGCDVAGLTSRFPETVMLLQYAYGWTIPSYNIVLEASDRRKFDWSIDDELAELIRSYNHLDVQLVEFVGAVMDRRLEQMKDKLQVQELPTYECDNDARHICHLINDQDIDWQALWDLTI